MIRDFKIEMDDAIEILKMSPGPGGAQSVGALFSVRAHTRGAGLMLGPACKGGNSSMFLSHINVSLSLNQ